MRIDVWLDSDALTDTFGEIYIVDLTLERRMRDDERTWVAESTGRIRW